MTWYANSNEHTVFDNWLNEQIPMAFARMRQNIIETPRPFSLSGIREEEFTAKTGAVMASPFHQSTKNAYAYHWTRDAAHTMGLITRIGRRNALPQAKLDTALYHRLMGNWIAFEKAIQRCKDGCKDGLDSNSPPDPFWGNFYAEAKYFLDGTSYVSDGKRPWANPQFDGPALRAIAMIRYAKELTDPTAACSLYCDAIVPDLKQTFETIGKSCIDAWEEVRGLHFNVLVTQIRALFDGIALAERLQQKCDTRWLERAGEYRDMLKREFLSREGFVRSTSSTTDCSVDLVDKYKVLHLDASVLGGIMLADGINGLPPLTSDVFLTTAKCLVEAFRDGRLPDVDGYFPNTNTKIDAKNLHDGGSFEIPGKDWNVTLRRDSVDSKYPINQQQDGLLGYAIGRYPEDRYNGYYSNHRDKKDLSDKNDTRGNPWFICTTNLGEFYYRVADAWLSEGTANGKRIELTSRAVDFLASLPRPVAVSAGKVTSSDELRKVVLALFDSGDAQLLRVQKHLHYGRDEKVGALSEQFTRDGGLPVGAQDLTWSYAAFLEAAMTRSQVVDKLAAQNEPR